MDILSWPCDLGPGNSRVSTSWSPTEYIGSGGVWACRREADALVGLEFRLSKGMEGTRTLVAGSDDRAGTGLSRDHFGNLVSRILAEDARRMHNLSPVRCLTPSWIGILQRRAGEVAIVHRRKEENWWYGKT